VIQEIAWMPQRTSLGDELWARDRYGVHRQQGLARHTRPRPMAQPDRAVELRPRIEVFDLRRRPHNDLDRPVPGLETLQPGNQPISSEGRHHADRDAVALRASARHVGRTRHRFPRRIQRSVIVAPDLGERESARQSLEQAHVKRSFQLLDAPAQRRHGQIHYDGRTRQAAGSRHGHEGLDVLQRKSSHRTSVGRSHSEVEPHRGVCRGR
jgi:hypothetical protein